MRDLHSFPTRRSSDLAVAGSNLKRWRISGSRAPTTDVAIVPETIAKKTDRLSLRISWYEWKNAKAKIADATPQARSEEHTSELQSLTNLVCRLLLEKK